MAKRYFPLDALTKIVEDATINASGVVQRFGADVVLKISPAREDFALVLDMETVKATVGDERYVFAFQGSNNDAFPAGSFENLAIIDFGAFGARPGGAKTSPAGRYVLDGSNEQGGVEYAYVRLNAIVAGTAPSIKLSAYLSER